MEVLLQRTRASTVAAIYPMFFNRFRDWQDIADAGIPELEFVFKPLGLWRRRARSLNALASYAADRKGAFPKSMEELLQVPGVGQYVANAILLFQHGQCRPLIDVNMVRVIERYIRPRRLADIRYDPFLQAAAHWLVRGPDPIRVNWATLDFADAVCKPQKPRCCSCQLRSWCNY